MIGRYHLSCKNLSQEGKSAINTRDSQFRTNRKRLRRSMNRHRTGCWFQPRNVDEEIVGMGKTASRGHQTCRRRGRGSDWRERRGEVRREEG